MVGSDRSECIVELGAIDVKGYEKEKATCEMIRTNRTHEAPNP
jgi:hypothetical protein